MDLLYDVFWVVHFLWKVFWLLATCMIVFQSINNYGIIQMVFKKAAWETLHEMHWGHGSGLATLTIRTITKSAETMKMSLNRPSAAY